ncbi:hypothetical protein ACU8V3_14805 [Cobetia marina]
MATQQTCTKTNKVLALPSRKHEILIHLRKRGVSKGMKDSHDVAVITQFTSSFTHQTHRETVSFFGRRHPLFQQVLKLRDQHHGVAKAYLKKHTDHDDVIDSNSQHICLMDTQHDTLLGGIRITPGGLESRTLLTRVMSFPSQKVPSMNSAAGDGPGGQTFRPWQSVDGSSGTPCEIQKW